MSKVLELKNLSYVYGTGTPFEKTAVNNLSLSIEKESLSALWDTRARASQHLFKCSTDL